MYENKIFKQTEYNSTDFFSLLNPDLYFIIDMTSESGVFPETYQGTLCRDYNQNVIARNVQLFIADDVRDLITKENVDDWIISVEQSEGVWHTRDIYSEDALTDESDYYQTAYFAINLSDTPLGNKFEEGYALDIMNFNKYKLYHKEEDASYHLVHKSV